MSPAAPTFAPTAPPATLTGQLSAWLAAFRPPHYLHVDAWSEYGLGHQELALSPPFASVPAAIIRKLEERWSLQLGCATRELDGTLATLAFAFVLWRPRLEFSEATDWRHRPRPEDLDAIAAALRDFTLEPTVLIDGYKEIATCWALTDPLDLRRHAARAVHLQRQLATRLGADVATGEALGTLIPVPGSIVRECGSPPPVATFAAIAPDRRYSVEQLEAAVTGAGAGRPKGGVQ